MIYSKEYFSIFQFLNPNIRLPKPECVNETCNKPSSGTILTVRRGADCPELAWYCSPVCAASAMIVEQASGNGWTRADILDHLAAAIAETPDADENADQMEFPPVDAHALKVAAGVKLGLNPDTKPAA